MIILGIETSCDETSAALVENGRKLLSCETASSLALHKKYGGIIPEIASRKQLETIDSVTKAALSAAGVGLNRINAVCVTDKPGLFGSLVVGVCFAKALSFSLNIPVLGVDHLESHIYAAFLNHKNIKLPFLALIVSGGHTSLFYVRDFHKVEPLGATNDDACGEAFDKVAKILGLGYPGGPYIEQAAKNGDAKKYKFACSNTQNPLDFSFSGIKTALLYHVQRSKPQDKQEIADLAAGFQESVIDTLIRKSFLACKRKRALRLVVGGGVVANSRLREKFLDSASAHGLEVYFPSKAFSMDNAAMVAGLGFQLLKKGLTSDLYLTPGLN